MRSGPWVALMALETGCAAAAIEARAVVAGSWASNDFVAYRASLRAQLGATRGGSSGCFG